MELKSANEHEILRSGNMLKILKNSIIFLLLFELTGKESHAWSSITFSIFDKAYF